MQVNVKGPQSKEREWFNVSMTKDRDQPYITVFVWFNIQFINQVLNGGDGRKMPSGGQCHQQTLTRGHVANFSDLWG